MCTREDGLVSVLDIMKAGEAVRSARNTLQQEPARLGSKILVKSYSRSKISTGNMIGIKNLGQISQLVKNYNRNTIGIKNLGQKLQLVKNYNRKHEWHQKSWSKITTGNTIGIKNLGQISQPVKNLDQRWRGVPTLCLSW